MPRGWLRVSDHVVKGASQVASSAAHGGSPGATVAGSAAGRIATAHGSRGSAGTRPGIAGAMARSASARSLIRPCCSVWPCSRSVSRPRVSLEPPDGLVLEVQGSLALFGGVSRLYRAFRAGCHAAGAAPVLTLAPTPLAALAGGRSGVSFKVLDQQHLVSAVSPLPLVRTALAAAGAAAALEAGCLPHRSGPATAAGGFCAALRPRTAADAGSARGAQCGSARAVRGSRNASGRSASSSGSAKIRRRSCRRCSRCCSSWRSFSKRASAASPGSPAGYGTATRCTPTAWSGWRSPRRRRRACRNGLPNA